MFKLFIAFERERKGGREEEEKHVREAQGAASCPPRPEEGPPARAVAGKGKGCDFRVLQPAEPLAGAERTVLAV